MDQAVHAPLQFHKGAEVSGLYHLADDYVAGLHVLGEISNPLNHCFSAGASRAADKDGAVFLDVNGDVELFDQAADGLAALANKRPYLVGVDLQREDARRVLGELRPGLRQRFHHLVQDMVAAAPCLLQGLGDHLGGDAFRDL